MARWKALTKLLNPSLPKNSGAIVETGPDRLPEALWAYRTTWHNTTSFSPYDLVYGKSVVFPIEFKIETLKIATEVNLDVTEAQKRRLK